MSRLENKLYKDYYGKLVKIEENERKKADRITEMEKNVQKRIVSLYQNIA